MATSGAKIIFERFRKLNIFTSAVRKFRKPRGLSVDVSTDVVSAVTGGQRITFNFARSKGQARRSIELTTFPKSKQIKSVLGMDTRATRRELDFVKATIKKSRLFADKNTKVNLQDLMVPANRRKNLMAVDTKKLFKRRRLLKQSTKFVRIRGRIVPIRVRKK